MMNLLADVCVAVAGAVAMYLLWIIFLEGSITYLWRRLKGYRVTLYEFSGSLQATKIKLRGTESRSDRGFIPGESVIEINQGPFRRRSAIYGDAARGWQVVRSIAHPRGQFVGLASKKTILVQDALKLINRYPKGLQQLLDDFQCTKETLQRSQDLCERFRQRHTEDERLIAKLDKKGTEAEECRKAWNTAIRGILKFIESDRQRHRSQAAQHIRELLEAVVSASKRRGETVPSDDAIRDWAEAFPILAIHR